jgi:hypothetical protein
MGGVLVGVVDVGGIVVTWQYPHGPKGPIILKEPSKEIDYSRPKMIAKYFIMQYSDNYNRIILENTIAMSKKFNKFTFLIIIILNNSHAGQIGLKHNNADRLG